MAPILYTYPLAYAPGKTVLALAEKGVAFTPQTIDLFNGQSLSPEYLKLNPHGTVPTLKDGDTLVPESKEIVEHVNNKDGKPLGGDKVDQTLAAAWADKIHAWDGNLFVAGNGDPGTAKVLQGLQDYKIKYAEARAKQHPELAQVYAEKIEGMKKAGAEGADKAKVAANLSQLTSILDDAEQQLAQSPYLAGEEYSIADVMFTPMLFRLGVVGKTGEYLKPRPKVSDYFNRVKTRPSFRQAFGAAENKLTAAKLLLPALVKSKFAHLTGWY